MRRPVKARSPWEDKFSIPTFSVLLRALPKHQAALVQQARAALLALDGVQEAVKWRGTCRWTLVYTTETDEGWAFIVPQPGRPIMSLPLQAELVACLPGKRMSRAVRDGLALAAQVGGVYWPQWELVNKPLVEELVVIARRKHSLTLAPAGS